MLKISWTSIYSDHKPITDTLITAIVCDLFSASENDSSKERQQNIFFTLCFGIPSEYPSTSKVLIYSNFDNNNNFLFFLCFIHFNYRTVENCYHHLYHLW